MPDIEKEDALSERIIEEAKTIINPIIKSNNVNNIEDSVGEYTLVDSSVMGDYSIINGKKKKKKKKKKSNKEMSTYERVKSLQENMQAIEEEKIEEDNFLEE